MIFTAMSTLALAQTADPLSQYASRRLDCWAENRYYSTTTISDDGVINSESGNYRVWGVKDGNGAPLDTVGFATRVGDGARVSELQTQSDAAKKRGRTTLMVGGSAALVGAAGSAYGWLHRAQPTTATGAPTSSGGGFALAYGSGLLAAGGLALGSWGYATLLSADTPLHDVTSAYDFGAAKARCEAYNGKLRQDLGLSPADTQSIDADTSMWSPVDRPERRNLTAWTAIGPGSLGVAGTF